MEKPLESLKNRYQNNFKSVRGGDYVHFLYYKCHK